MMVGTLANTLGALVGSMLGLLLGKRLPERVGDAVIQAFGLLTIFLGITGAMEMQNVLVVILSLAIGTMIGEALDLQKRMEQFSTWMQEHFGGKESNFSKAFVTATLLSCAGAMGIVGALQGGLIGNHTMLYTKAIIDAISFFFLAASLGLGVVVASGSILVYQGSIVLLAMAMGPFLSDAMVTEMGAVGSLLLVGLGLNILGASKLRLMNYIPAIFLPILLVGLSGLLG